MALIGEVSITSETEGDVQPQPDGGYLIDGQYAYADFLDYFDREELMDQDERFHTVRGWCWIGWVMFHKLEKRSAGATGLTVEQDGWDKDRTGAGENFALKSMKKIAIVGCGGAGKSTLARQLGWLLGLPVIHLDAEFWKPGWQMIAKVDEQRAHKQSWSVLTGLLTATTLVYAPAFAAADTIIFLDFPTLLCLWRVISGTGTTGAKHGPIWVLIAPKS